MTFKSGYRLRKGDQIPTRTVTIVEIMSGPSFALGVADARAGRGYHRDYDLWDTNTQWTYERGRQWAAQAPYELPLKRDGVVTRQAQAWYLPSII